MQVTTREELKTAQMQGEREIVVVGKLATDLWAAKKIAKMSKFAIGMVTAALGAGAIAAVPTGGLSLGISTAALAPIAATTGISLEALVLISVLGVSFIISLCEGYTWSYSFKSKTLTMKMKK